MDTRAKSGDRILFRETQWSPVWVFILIVPAGLLAAGAAIIGLIKDQNPAFCLPLLALGLVINLLRVQTLVSEKWLTVTFGAWFPMYRRRICVGDIAGAESVVYRPVAEYGGWGIRGFAGNQALSARGDLGVRLVLAGGEKLLIGSGKPDELAHILLPRS